MKDPRTGQPVSNHVLDLAKDITCNAMVSMFLETGYDKTDVDDILHRVKAKLENVYGKKFS